MKKTIFLLLVFGVVGGCNKEKIYKENLNGVWHVYKYLLKNVDKTLQFQNRYLGYSIAFTESGQFTELVTTNPDTLIVEGTYSFVENDEKIVLSHYYYTYLTDSVGDTISTISHEVLRPYTIFNLTKEHVQLRNDTSQLYMNKD